MSELKACPFCGCSPDFEEIDRGHYIVWSVGCIPFADSKEECRGYQGMSGYNTKREAALAWNTRHLEDKLQSQLDTALEALKKIKKLQSSLGSSYRVATIHICNETIKAIEGEG
jgi:hypothetical protein